MTPLKTLAALALAGLALSACGSKDESPAAQEPRLERLDLVLDYFPNADHAGIYAAQASGAFRRAGLDVRIRTPADPAAPLKLVEAGRAEVAISYEPEVLLARDKGASVVSIGALVQQPLTSLMALGKARISGVKDLEGKTVGTAGIPYQAAYLKTILEGAGVDPAKVKQVDVGFNLVPAMLSKKVDATLGAFWNYEGVQLEREKREPTIIRMDKVGVPVYNELVFVSTKETLQKKGVGTKLRRFLQALAQGHEQLRRDPTAGVDALVKANPDLDPAFQMAAVKATLPAFFPQDTSHAFGWQDVTQWEAYGRWMLENKLISKLPTPTSVSNEFVPGEGI